jgi:putative ABC transport system permease protein
MVNNRDLGFDYDRVLKVESNEFSSIGEVAARIRDIPGVEDIAIGASPIKEGFGSMSEIMDADKVTKYSFYYIQPEYPSFFHFELVDGRLPVPGEVDVALVNESFVESAPSFGPGKTINALGDKKYTVIGILKNFHARSLENDYSPLVYFVGGMRGAYSNSFMIRIEPLADAAEILQKARSIYSEMKDIPEEEIEAGFLTQDIKKLYEHEIRQTRLIQLSSVLSLIITLIGILGVVWLDTRFMRKEIAIRKVNGATKREILKQVGWKYLIIATVGFIIAAPIAYAIGNRWLQQFAFRINIPAWLFVVAFVVIILITMVTVILQAWQAASANPVEAIKNE